MTHNGSPPDDAERRLEELLAEHREPADDAEDAEDETTDSATEDPTASDPFAPVATADTVDENPDDAPAEDPLPDAPLFALLRTIEHDIGIDRIDRIWVFPPRRLEAGETAVVVVAAFPDIAADRRRVYAAHYTLSGDADQPHLALDEYGTAPTDRVGRLVEEVVERIKDGPADAPRSHPIHGADDRWNAVLHDLAQHYLDETQRNPRLRR